jgi:hypothetical protein
MANISFAVSSFGSLEEGSLTWLVSPAHGRTIANTGLYTASGAAGHHTVYAT